MSVTGYRDIRHNVVIEWLPQTYEMKPGVFGTSLSPRFIAHITCGECGNEHTCEVSCPQCGATMYNYERGMNDEEIALAEAAGIDHKDESNWDKIEHLAEVAEEWFR